MNGMTRCGHEWVLVVTGSGNAIVSVAFRFTYFLTVFAGFVFLFAGSVIGMRQSLIP
jgi:hypothetical protein